MQNSRTYTLVSSTKKHLDLDCILADCRHGFRSHPVHEARAVSRGQKRAVFNKVTREAIIQTLLIWDKRVHP